MRLLRLVAVLSPFLLASNALAAQVADADAAWNQGRFGAAREAYLVALVQDPGSVRAAYRLGILAAWDGNLDSALTYLARARTADPDDPDVRAMQAQVFAWAGRYPQALVQWDSLIAQYPARLDGLVGKARTLAWAGRTLEADTNYGTVLARDPTNAEALDGRAQLAFWGGKTAEAIAGYRRALGYRPADVVARVGLARVYQSAGRQLDALAQADSAVAAAPTDRDAVRAQRDIRRAILAATDVSVGWSNDTDDNTMWWQVVSAATPLSNRVRGFGAVGSYEGTSTSAVSAARATAEFGATYTQARWRLTGAFGVQGLWPEASRSRSVLTARVVTSVQLRPALGVGVSYTRFPFAETASLIGADLDIDAVDGSLDATLRPGLALSAGGGAGWYSDGNQRRSAVLAVTKQLPRHFFAGGMGRMVWHDARGVGYFSPDRFALFEARGGHARTGQNWETRVGGGAGLQQIGLGGDWQFEGHLEGRAVWWFSPRNRLETFAGVSNSATVSATGAYRWGTAGAVVKLGL
jgi:tetratricopeptide (TPR) repeat protein